MKRNDIMYEWSILISIPNILSLITPPFPQNSIRIVMDSPLNVLTKQLTWTRTCPTSVGICCTLWRCTRSSSAMTHWCCDAEIWGNIGIYTKFSLSSKLHDNLIWRHKVERKGINNELSLSLWDPFFGNIKRGFWQEAKIKIKRGETFQQGWTWIIC